MHARMALLKCSASVFGDFEHVSELVKDHGDGKNFLKFLICNMLFHNGFNILKTASKDSLNATKTLVLKY